MLVKLPKMNKWSTLYEPMFFVVCSIHGFERTGRRVRDRLTVCLDASKFKLASAIVKTTDEPGISQKAQSHSQFWTLKYQYRGSTQCITRSYNSKTKNATIATKCKDNTGKES